MPSGPMARVAKPWVFAFSHRSPHMSRAYSIRTLTQPADVDEARHLQRPAPRPPCAAPARAPAGGAARHRPRSLDDLSLDCERIASAARSSGARCGRLAPVRPRSMESGASQRAALTEAAWCAPRPESRAGAARRQRTLDAGRCACTLWLAGRRLLKGPAPEPVRRRGRPFGPRPRTLDRFIRGFVPRPAVPRGEQPQAH